MRDRTPLYGWLTSDAISISGTRISMIALPWFVLVTTGSPTKTGLVALAEMLPLVLMKVLGGPIIDHLGARRVAITCDLGSVVAVGAIPLLHEAGHLAFPGFLALVAVAGALRGPGDAAKYALVPALVARGGVSTERATGLHGAVERTASMVGAAGAGVLIAAIGPANAILVDALSFGASAAVLACSTRGLGSPAPAEHAEPETSSYGRRLHEGWDFLRHDRVLLGITIMVALTNLLDLAWASVLMPVWGRETGGGAAAIGAVFATFAGASAVGAVCAAAWGDRLPRYKVYLFAFLITGLPRFVVLALDVPLFVVLGFCVVGGFASGFLNPVLGAVILERIPEPLVGRVTSLSTAACFALMPFGGVLGGALVSGFGLSSALLLVGVAYFAVTMLPAVDPHWREIDRRRDREPVPVSA
jgi:MFS family permease